MAAIDGLFDTYDRPRRLYPLKRSAFWLALLAASVAASSDANAQSATPLASWVRHADGYSVKYSLRIEGGALVDREENDQGGWSEYGLALSDINCGYLMARPLGDPHPTNIIMNFLTDEDCLLTKKCSQTPARNRVWARNVVDPTPKYLQTSLSVYFDYSDKDNAVAIGNKVLDATGGRAQVCPN